MFGTPQGSQAVKAFLSGEATGDMHIVIGNPPFNFMGQIKVPTSKLNKKNDGQIVWPDFVVKSISLLKKDTGLLFFFIPSLWLKPDKKGMVRAIGLIINGAYYSRNCGKISKQISTRFTTNYLQVKLN